MWMFLISIFLPSPSLHSLFIAANTPLQIPLLHCQVDFHSFTHSTLSVAAILSANNPLQIPIGSQILIYFSLIFCCCNFGEFKLQTLYSEQSHLLGFKLIILALPLLFYWFIWFKLILLALPFLFIF